MKAWNVYLNNRIIDTVFIMSNSGSKDIRGCLVNRDGYDPRIVVRLNYKMTERLV